MTDKQDPCILPLTAGTWQQLCEWLRSADIDCLEIESPGAALRMVRGTGGYRAETLDAGTSVPGKAAPPAPVAATAPCAGVFLDRHPLGTDGLALQGHSVRMGDRLGFMQIGLLLVPVVAPVGGRVGRLLVAAGMLVGYGARLIEIEEEHA